MSRSFQSLNRAVCLLLLFSSNRICLADFIWEEKAIFVDAKLGESKTIVNYSFNNSSDRVVSIKNIATSCHCAAAKLKKTQYGPNEGGKIEVTFDHGTRVGPQKNTIIVETDDPDSPTTELNLTVRLSQWVEIKPAFAIWKVGATDDSKEFTVKLNANEMEVVKVVCKDKAFEVDHAIIDGGAKIVVKPTSTDKPARVPIDIQVRLPDKSLKMYQVFAIVK